LKKFKPTYKPFGASTILIEWPSKIDEAIIRDIVVFEKSIDKNRGILDTMITYNALTIRYDCEIDFEEKVADLKNVYKERRKYEVHDSKCWQIPVCYDMKFGLDLDEISRAKKLSMKEVIELHTAPEYLIYFIGFQPGFLYLGGLNKKIHIPRKASPRLRVPKGSVGIGGEQTGVYPHESAGGWNILGKSPLDFFDASKPDPCFAKAGDRIKFEPIDVDEFHEIEAAVQDGSFELKNQSL